VRSAEFHQPRCTRKEAERAGGGSVYSMTRSARCGSEDGIVRPSALAVLRLTRLVATAVSKSLP
jgi:hypothetical protein